MALIVGLAGATRNAAAAVCEGRTISAVCEQERITRTRRAGLKPGELPSEALEVVLDIAHRHRSDISAFAVAESAIELPPETCVQRVDHHHSHAATAFHTSPFRQAIVLVCDRHGPSELTVWRGDEAGLQPLDFPWIGPGFASVYSRLADVFGFASDGDEHEIEALAHSVAPSSGSPLPLAVLIENRLELSRDFTTVIRSALCSNGHHPAISHTARVAEQAQRHLGELLVAVLSEIKRRFGGEELCLGGGLFYNSYFNTLLAQSGLYLRTFVPVNPGNAGVAVGAALTVAGPGAESAHPVPLSAFLGPAYDTDAIKATLENCKLSYDFVRDGQVIDRTVSALADGKLVGWFHGRMEWGPRALGNRSILASPIAPFVLENLNYFLKKREPHRSYSVSICTEDLPRYFRGPASSPFMEYEYEVIQPEVLRGLLPLSGTKLRVQTVPPTAGVFHTLIKAFGEATGVPILVNTSYNGFHEPIVCTPRDAVRVFYGTGLDMTVMGNFILHK